MVSAFTFWNINVLYMVRAPSILCSSCAGYKIFTEGKQLLSLAYQDIFCSGSTARMHMHFPPLQLTFVLACLLTFASSPILEKDGYRYYDLLHIWKGCWATRHGYRCCWKAWKNFLQNMRRWCALSTRWLPSPIGLHISIFMSYYLNLFNILALVKHLLYILPENHAFALFWIMLCLNSPFPIFCRELEARIHSTSRVR